MPTLLSVGAAAGRLGVAPATVRSWERRYGLAPGGRSSGGHRRYTEADLGRLHLMQELVSRGQTPAAAARAVLEQQPRARQRRRPGRPCPGRTAGGRRRANHGGGPGGRVLAVPGASPEVRGLARAASRLDADAATGQLGDLLVDRGAVRTWNEVLRPVLASIGERWVRAGVDVEHVLQRSGDGRAAVLPGLPAPPGARAAGPAGRRAGGAAHPAAARAGRRPGRAADAAAAAGRPGADQRAAGCRPPDRGRVDLPVASQRGRPRCCRTGVAGRAGRAGRACRARPADPPPAGPAAGGRRRGLARGPAGRERATPWTSPVPWRCSSRRPDNLGKSW